MKTLRVLYGLTAAALLLTWAPPAHAGSADDLVEEAKELQSAGRLEDAAVRFGKALASAQKKGKLDAEERAAVALDGLFGSNAAFTGGAIVATQGGGGVVGEEERDLLALVMSQLDEKRNGAFVSSPVLARRLLLLATELGDFEHVRAARGVLAANSKRGGRASSVLLAYADGLLALANAEPSKAEPHLRQALDAATEERWVDVATHAAAEIAAIRVAAGDVAGAEKVLSDLTEELDGEIATQSAALWQRAIRGRIPDAGANLLNIVSRSALAAAPTAPAPVVADGGFGKSKSTELGRALKRFSKSKPLATVTRGLSGFVVKRHFDPKGQQEKRYRAGQQRVDFGGLVITLRGRAVALHQARTENEGAKGISGGVRATATGLGVGSIARAEYLIGSGESWGVTKAGVVTIGAQ